MAFLDELDALVSQPSSPRSCKIRNILNHSGFSEEDQAKLTKVVEASRDSSGFVNNVRLTKFLNAQGFEVSVSAIDRHRRGMCACTTERSAS